MTTSGKWWFAALSACALCACATTGKDVTGSGDERLDETSRPEGAALTDKGPTSTCGEGGGDLVLIDARTGDPVSCALVTLSRDVEGCEPSAETECPTEVVSRGRTSKLGELKLPNPELVKARLSAVAEGYVASVREPAAVKPGKPAEIEMVPSDGFLLKFVDADGNYLPGISVSFKQGDTVLAQMKTNDLANVYFNERTPFGGEPVVVEAEGFAPLTISGPEDLGADGNTVTLSR